MSAATPASASTTAARAGPSGEGLPGIPMMTSRAERLPRGADLLVWLAPSVVSPLLAGEGLARDGARGVEQAGREAHVPAPGGAVCAGGGQHLRQEVGLELFNLLSSPTRTLPTRT